MLRGQNTGLWLRIRPASAIAFINSKRGVSWHGILLPRRLGDFEASWQLRWLLQRAIEIISEASRAIPDALAGTEPEIPWRKVSIGNVLRHDYEGLWDRIIWNVVLDELPRLKRAIQAIAKRADD